MSKTLHCYHRSNPLQLANVHRLQLALARRINRRQKPKDCGPIVTPLQMARHVELAQSLLSAVPVKNWRVLVKKTGGLHRRLFRKVAISIQTACSRGGSARAVPGFTCKYAMHSIPLFDQGGLNLAAQQPEYTKASGEIGANSSTSRSQQPEYGALFNFIDKLAVSPKARSDINSELVLILSKLVFASALNIPTTLVSRDSLVADSRSFVSACKCHTSKGSPSFPSVDLYAETT